MDRVIRRVKLFSMPPSQVINLEYASSPPRYLRPRRLLFLCALSFLLGVSCCLVALPVYQHHEGHERSNQIRREEILKRFEEQMLDAKQAAAKGEVNDGLAALEAAKVARDADSELFTQNDLDQMTARISQEQTRINAIAATKPKVVDIERSGETIDIRLSTVSTLVTRCREQAKAGHYRQARGICEQILLLDAENDFGRAIAPLLADLTDSQLPEPNREKSREAGGWKANVRR